tara:strand:- start:463 stop:930 length:468 start_codon:yes stop_codon:yes gene_type:complete
MLCKFKNHKVISSLLFFVILIGCQFQESIKTHGIVYLENRSKMLNIKQSNKNDVIKAIGQPQIKSYDNDDMWIYVERVLTKGSIHRLGKNVLKENNILALRFDKYGILTEKKLFQKDEINNIDFSKKITENEITKKSFVASFLESVRQKMYQGRK